MMIDLAALPPPSLLEDLDFEALYAAKLARFKRLCPDYNAVLESDFAVKMLELAAYDEMMYRARVNDAALSRLLAFAEKGDLDHAVAFLGVKRIVIDAGDPDADPPRDPVYEGDDRLRLRGQMALESASVAGSEGAYRFHALSASADVADVSVDAPRFERVAVPPAVAAQLPAGAFVLVATYSAGLDDPMPGDVAINVLAVKHDDEVYKTLLPLVESYLSADTLRPLTDHPRARKATPVNYRVRAAIEFEQGPDPAVADAASRSSLDQLIAASHKLDADVPRSGIFAALHGVGVKRVALAEPQADVMCAVDQFPLCDGIEITRTI